MTSISYPTLAMKMNLWKSATKIDKVGQAKKAKKAKEGQFLRTPTRARGVKKVLSQLELKVVKESLHLIEKINQENLPYLERRCSRSGS